MRSCSRQGCEKTREDNRKLRAHNRRLRQHNSRLERCKVRLERERAKLREKLGSLKELLDKQRRAGKRQAAPFSKGPPRAQPRRPGRRAGAAYGRKAYRPAPDHVDETFDAPLPQCCPHCQGAIDEIEVRAQHQTDLPPVTPRVTRFEVHIGQCTRCGRRVQGRHPQQSSDALGAAGSLLGPRALVLASDLNKGLGLSFEKVSRLFEDLYGLSVTRGGLSGAVARAARAAEPTYNAMRQWIRQAPVVSPDETGWRVEGRSAWLWVFVSPVLTVYAIRRGRGFVQAAEVLGEGYSGSLARDGWAPYRKFEQARHQSCLAHLLRRCRERLETAPRGLARVPRAVQRILNTALSLRDRRDAGQLSAHGLRVAVGRIRAKMDRLLEWKPTDTENAKLLAHLTRERDALFTFLLDPDVPATNFWAEQAIRPAVVTRKVWGGNRTWQGAHTQEVLASVLRTSRQQGKHPYPILADLLTSPQPVVAELLRPSGPDPPPH